MPGIQESFDPAGSPAHFDFDEWRRLAEGNPRAYFRKRQRTLAAFIATHPAHEKSLSRLQEKVDDLRAASGSPQQALRGIMQLLDDHISALGGQLAQLERELDGLRSGLEPSPAIPAAPENPRRQ